MSATENRTISIWIDDKGLEEKLTSYNKKYESLNREIKKLEPGTDAFIKKSLEMEKVKKLIDQTEGQLSGKLGPTLRQLQDQQRKLNLELSQMPVELRKTSEAGMKLSAINAKLADIKAETNQTTAAMKRLNSEKQSMITKAVNGFGKAADTFNRYAGAIVAGAAAFAGVVFGFKSAVEAAQEYEDALAELSALTGLTGKELGYLSDEAKRLSTTTLESGVRITKSAKDIVDAYKIVGSQRPELLKNKEALNEVTTQALILSEAAKIDLSEAVKGVTTVLNQFNESGDQANRIVNALAAGSKEGAAEVSYISDALNRAGTVSNQAGVSIEQTIGVIETLAPRFASSEQAGTALRGTLLKLTTGADEFNPKVVGLETALDNLAKKNLSANDMLKMFGEQNITAASIMIKYRDEITQYTKAVTDTNVATEQAAINTATSSAKLAQNRNEIAKNTIELGEKLAPAMVLVTGVWNKFLAGLNEFLATPISDKMEQERVELQKTHATLISTNISHEQRVKLIKELQTKYPEYLKSINAETVTNTELSAALKKVNDQLINKIILQKQDEKIEESNAYIAKAKMAVFEQEDKLRDKMVKLAEKYNITIKEGATLQEQANLVYQQAAEIDDKRRNMFQGKAVNDIARFGGEIRNLSLEYKNLNALTNVNNGLLDAREALKKRLGIKDEVVVKNEIKKEKEADPFTTGGGEDKLEKAAKKVADKKLKAAQHEADRLYKMQVDEFERQFKLAEDNADDELKLLIKTNKAKFDEIKDFYDKEVAAALDYAIVSAQTSEERHAAEVDKIRTQANDKLALLEEGSFQYKLVYEQMLKDIAATDKQYADDAVRIEQEKQDRRLATAQTFISAAEDIGNQLMAHTQKQNAKELSNLAAKNTQEKELLKQKLDNKLISQAQYDAEVEKLDRQYAEKENAARQQELEQQKTAAMFSAAIKVIMAWIEAYINPLKIPQAIAASAQQVALVALQVPEFYDGGYLPKSASDRQAFPIIAHGNEYMVPASEMRDPAVANFAAMVETSRKGGASVSDQLNSSSNASSQTPAAPQQVDPRFFPVMEQLLTVLQSGIKTDVVFDDERLFKMQQKIGDNQKRDEMITF